MSCASRNGWLQNSWLLLAMLGSLVSGTLGCNQGNLSNPVMEDVSSSADALSADALPEKISLQAALKTVELAISGEHAYSLEREMEDEQSAVEVGIGGREVFVHALTGRIFKTEDLRQTSDPEDKQEIEEFLVLQPLAGISILEALEIGETFAGEKAHTIELENENGNLVYEISVGLNEIYVDAGNGEVLYAEDGDVSIGEEEWMSSIQVPGSGNE